MYVCLYTYDLKYISFLNHLRAVADIMPVYFWIFHHVFLWWRILKLHCDSHRRLSSKTVVQFSKSRNLMLIQYRYQIIVHMQMLSVVSIICFVAIFSTLYAVVLSRLWSRTVLQLFFVFHKPDDFEVCRSITSLNVPQFGSLWCFLMIRFSLFPFFVRIL